MVYVEDSGSRRQAVPEGIGRVSSALSSPDRAGRNGDDAVARGGEASAEAGRRSTVD